MNALIDALVSTLRELMKSLNAEQRRALFDQVADGYCKHCGYEQPESIRGCQCQNDE